MYIAWATGIGWRGDPASRAGPNGVNSRLFAAGYRIIARCRRRGANLARSTRAEPSAGLLSLYVSEAQRQLTETNNAAREVRTQGSLLASLSASAAAALAAIATTRNFPHRWALPLIPLLLATGAGLWASFRSWPVPTGPAVHSLLTRAEKAAKPTPAKDLTRIEGGEMVELVTQITVTAGLIQDGLRTPRYAVQAALALGVVAAVMVGVFFWQDFLR